MSSVLGQPGRHAIPTLDDVAALAQAIAAELVPPALILLSGPLGAGKSELVRQLLPLLGVSETILSPTFGYLRSYPVGTTTYHHFDLYRLGDEEELEFLGVRDLMRHDAVWLVEWPEKAPSLTHHATATLTFSGDEGDRMVTIEPGPGPDWR
ncbi:MAG: tRNA (adenosine(37)-N6)-threonylcarbamoyltransferase complex ATPase subunit type 1 TsaE [Alphaproteobacteria bacterium CG_4_10_14_0_2_um_filter_63_37]|nr:MAG: tRNA (adenosine(37)-N6)-threonylcarbamoyltransferase complex ATPase subunit type 1 TsaE [Proteobacteria bacterium CG1_02_64_396]PJA25836.1 MAG: tRNA (adenosine(37)-N6)-threonylcarbamoyltransferase complex ATPase subunit type 1 TsaE [Alphaproteobacteria bacterium CG_4_10_14_0_2_um_filter_63_37]